MRIFRYSLKTLIIASLCGAAGSASATSLPFQSAAAVVAAALPVTDICVAYIYDANGNRISRTTEEITTATSTWGTGVYGCFFWTS